MTSNYKSTSVSDYDRFYRRERSLTLLLLAAVRRCSPGTDVIVHHRFSGGLYCTAVIPHGNEVERTTLDTGAVEAEMRAIVASGETIQRVEKPVEEVTAYMRENDWPGTARLIDQMGMQRVDMWRLAEVDCWFPDGIGTDPAIFGEYGLEPFQNGFVLRFSAPKADRPFRPSQKLYEALMIANEWGVKTRVYDFGSLNHQIYSDPVGLILTSEALHSQHLTDVARSIEKGLPDRRIVLIAGPSSSGKTTFSRRLTIQLRALGIYSTAIQLDDYFVDRELCPRDANGEYDFEHFACLDCEALSKDVGTLLRGEPLQLRRFDFVEGKSTRSGRSLQLRNHDVLVLEGIHALNPELLPGISSEQITRIFVSALTNLNIDRHSRVATSDLRLIRRMIRDNRTRGNSPAATLTRWDSVRRGEDKWIFPYQDIADLLFNSSLAYEIAVLRDRARRLLAMTQTDGLAAIHGERIGNLLNLVRPLESRVVPLHSVIREFTGGGIWE